MDRAYDNALKRKEEIERELAQINSFLALYQRFSGSEEEQIEPDTGDSPVGGNKKLVNPRASRRLRPPEIADLAERVIRGAGHPLTRSEIVSRLESAGVELHSEDKPRYLGTILWREKERFTNIAGQGYVMSDMVTEQPSIMDLIGRAADEEETKNDEKDKSAFD